MAFAIDEYGEVQGLVTLHDLVEAITGEFQPRDPASAWAVPPDGGGWLLDSHISVIEEERGPYHTPSWCCSC